MQHKNPIQPIDESNLKVIEVEDLKIYVDNDQVGQRIKDALTHAEVRKWYQPAVEQLILYGKESENSGQIEIIALNLESQAKIADDAIYYPKKENFEIRISTIDANSVQERILLENNNHTLELGNPPNGQYTNEVLEHAEKMQSALLKDYAEFSKDRDSQTRLHRKVEKLIFGLLDRREMNEHTPEQLCYALQALAHSDNECQSVAPNYTRALRDYVNFENVIRSKLPITPDLVYPNEIYIPKNEIKLPIAHNPDITVEPINPYASSYQMPGYLSKGFKYAGKGVKAGNKLLKLYKIASESNEHYGYLRDHDPQLFAHVTTINTHTQFAGQCTFWNTLIRINPYLGIVLKIASEVDKSPDSKKAYLNAWSELNPEDITKYTPEQEYLNLLYYDDHRGPCYGLKPEKLKELGPGVLKLNHELLEGQALDIPLRTIGGYVNQTIDTGKRGIYLASDTYLQSTGYGKPNPSNTLDQISQFTEIKKQLANVNPKNQYQNKGDILSQTLSPTPPPQPKPLPGNTPVTEQQKPSTPEKSDKPSSNAENPGKYGAPQIVAYESELRDGSRQNIDSKKQYTPLPSATHTPNPANKMQFSLSFYGDGAEFGGLLAFTIEEAGPELFALCSASLVFGGIITGIAWMYQKEKFRERVDLIKSQCNFISDEMMHTFHIYERTFDKLIAYENATTSSEKEHCYVKALKALERAKAHTVKMLAKYERLAHEKHVKLHVVTIDPFSAAIEHFEKKKIIFSHPKMPKPVLQRMQNDLDQAYKKAKNAPKIYHHSAHAPRKQTREFIEKQLPVLNELNDKIDNLVEAYANNAMSEIVKSLLASDASYELIRQNYEMGKISKDEFEKVAARYLDDVSKAKSSCELLLQIIPEGNPKIPQVNALIGALQTDIGQHAIVLENAHSNRLANDLNALTNQLSSDLLGVDEYKSQANALIANVSKENKATWHDLINGNVKIHEDNKIINIFNEGFNSFKSNYNDYYTHREKFASVIKQFKEGKIDKERFQQAIAEIVAQINALTSAITTISANPNNLQPDLVNNYKHELAIDQHYYTNLFDSTLNDIYSSRISDFNASTSKYRDDYMQRANEFQLGNINEDEFIKSCDDLFNNFNTSINNLINDISSDSLCTDENKILMSGIIESLPSIDDAHCVIISSILGQVKKETANEDLAKVFTKFDEHWHLVNNKTKHSRFLLGKAYVANEHNDFKLANETANQVLSLDAKNFNALMLVIRSDIRLESPDGKILSTIEKYQSEFTEEREIVTLQHYAAVIKKDVDALSQSYERVKSMEDLDERLQYMSHSHQLRESLIDPRRRLAISTGHADGVKMLQINRWLELVVAHSLKIDKLKNDIKPDTNAETTAHLQAEIKEHEEHRDKAVRIAASQYETEQNAGHYKAINRLNYGHLTADVFMKLISQRLQNSYHFSEKQLQLVSQGVGQSFQLLTSTIGATLYKTTEADLITRAGLSSEQSAGIFTALNAPSNDDFLKMTHQWLHVGAPLVALTKLAIVFSDYQLQSAYEKYVNDTKDKKKLSYDDWLKECNSRRETAENTNTARLVTDTYSNAQMLLSLYSFVSDNTNPLSIARRATTAFLNLPILQNFLHSLFIAESGEVSESRLYAFYSLMLEHLYGNQLQQLFFAHEDTILTAICDALQNTPYLGTAVKIFSSTAEIQNSIHAFRWMYAIYKSILGSDERVLASKIYNLKVKFGQISEILSHAVSDDDKIKAYRIAASMYCDIKYSAAIHIDRHPEAAKLRVIALYHQHLLANDIKITMLNGDDNGLFNAVSAYTLESPQQLRELCVNSPNTPGDAICIHTLSRALNRQIVVVFNLMLLDLLRQGLDSPGSIISGDPIFVRFDERLKTYHILEMRGELYYEQLLTRKLSQPQPQPKDSTMVMISSLGKTTMNQSLKERTAQAQKVVAKLPDLDNLAELRKRASVNKVKLTGQSVNLFKLQERKGKGKSLSNIQLHL